MFSSKRSLRGERFRRRFFVGLSRPFSQRDFAFLAGGGANAARSGGDFVFVSAGFSHILENRVRVFAGVSYIDFLVVGLTMMSILQNSFANSASSLVQSRVTGNLVFVLLPPISPFAFFAAYALASVVRGLCVGAAVLAVGLFFADDLSPAAPWAVCISRLWALCWRRVGDCGGIVGGKIRSNGAVPNFVIMPLTFLSGVFYSLASLPPLWRTISQGNPFFYMIDGFRHGFFGQSDEGLGAAFLFTTAGALAACAWAWRLVAIGYKTRS